MANNCLFDMKIVGVEKNIQEFIQMMKWQGPYKENGLGRVFSFEIDPTLHEKDPRGGDLVSVVGIGDCAWSFKGAVLDNTHHNILDETARLGLVLEIYTSEPGIGFQEHLLINKDEIVVNETVDYEEHWIEGAEESVIEELAEEKGMTVEELKSKVNCNGDYCEGGFEDYADFDDLFSYLEPVHHTSLDAKISDAKSRTVQSHASSAEKEQTR